MASNPKTIITIAGATGNLAQSIIRHLLSKNKPDVLVRGYARNPLKLPDDIKNHPSFSIIQGEVDDVDRIREAVRGASVVICCYQGMTEVIVDGQKLLIDVCEAEHVDRFFASTFASDIRGLKPGEHERMDLAIEVAKYLERKNIRAVHVLNGAFMEAWYGYLKILQPEESKFTYWGTGDEVWDLMTVEDAAKFTAEAALDKEAGGWLKFRGDCKTTLEIAQIYERIHGKKLEVVRRGSLQDLHDFMWAEKAKYEKVNPWAYMAWFYQYVTLTGVTLLRGEMDNKRYPEVKPMDIEQFFRKQAG